MTGPGLARLAGAGAGRLVALDAPALAAGGPAPGGPAPGDTAAGGAAGRERAAAGHQRVLGAKAARLAAALRAGLPVLPGWVVPVRESLPAVTAAAEAMRRAGRPAGRRAVLSLPVDPALAAELRAAVQSLGGQVIVRSSSPLEADSRWSGAFSSVTEVGPEDVTAAVRSCWAAAFAVDPLERLAACGLPPAALELGLVIQPELRPDAGGVAWVAGDQVTVEGVAGHPAALLSGWAEGARARLRLRAAGGPRLTDDGGLAGLLRPEVLTAVAGLAGRVYQALGDDTIEWAVGGTMVWLLQAGRRAAPDQQSGCPPPAREESGPLLAPGTDGLAARERMPLLAALAQEQGRHVPARPAVPGTAAGRLVACRPHERRAASARDAVLLIDRPVPAFAPLLFGARGVIVQAGAAGSHLAGVARSLGVPMVTGCRLDAVLGQASEGQEWIAAIDGAAGDVALLPAAAIGRASREGTVVHRRP